MTIPLPVITDVHRVALRWLHAATGQTAVNVMHVLCASSPHDPSIVFGRLDAFVLANMWAAQSSGASITHVDITPLDGTTATTTFPTGSPAKWSGENAGDFIPALSNVIKIQTGVRGRDNRGRLFLPFVTENEVSDGQVGATNAAPITVAWQTFQTNLFGDATHPISLGVAAYDRRHAGSAAHFTAATNIQCEVVAATQRRRQSRLRV